MLRTYLLASGVEQLTCPVACVGLLLCRVSPWWAPLCACQRHVIITERRTVRSCALHPGCWGREPMSALGGGGEGVEHLCGGAGRDDFLRPHQFHPRLHRQWGPLTGSPLPPTVWQWHMKTFSSTHFNITKHFRLFENMYILTVEWPPPEHLKCCDWQSVSTSLASKWAERVKRLKF